MILHIAAADEWDAARALGEYSADTLLAEGFIHCSTPAQVLVPANERFHGRTDLLLLVIDPARLEAALVYEDCYETGQAFPHIYGPLNLNAVLRAVPFPPSADGSFALPPL
ncbi:MAG TPA: DUF952 domain-containing protein [Promineifilum sp.]|nr:DUF952 domain-containing protein [Promineifilum sp.]